MTGSPGDGVPAARPRITASFHLMHARGDRPDIHPDVRCAGVAYGARVSVPVPRTGTGTDTELPALADLVGGLGHHLEQISDDAEVGEVEDGRLGVLVDRHDRLGRLHAGPVLDRAGDAQGDVELRVHRLACLPDLELVRVEAGVAGRARRADRGTEQVGELLDQLEVLRAAEAPTAGDHDGRLGQLRPRALLLGRPGDHL